MPIQLTVGETDDPLFIELLNSLVGSVLDHRNPETFWIIQIDNWFDHKWLNFSGYGLIASNTPMERYDTVKAESYQEKLTFPPFTPNRIMAQWSYIRTSDDYIEAPLPALPHGIEKRHSEENLRRRVQDFSRSASFVWYSANTLANGRGSVMVYNVTAEQPDCWYAAFNRQAMWELLAAKGISRSEVEKLFSNENH